MGPCWTKTCISLQVSSSWQCCCGQGQAGKPQDLSPNPERLPAQETANSPGQEAPCLSTARPENTPEKQKLLELREEPQEPLL